MWILTAQDSPRELLLLLTACLPALGNNRIEGANGRNGANFRREGKWQEVPSGGYGRGELCMIFYAHENNKAKNLRCEIKQTNGTVLRWRFAMLRESKRGVGGWGGKGHNLRNRIHTYTHTHTPKIGKVVKRPWEEQANQRHQDRNVPVYTHTHTPILHGCI